MYFRRSHVCAHSWMCKKQTSVSHSSTEAEIISIDAVLPIDGITAVDLWDLVIEVFHSVSCQAKHAQLHPNQAHQRHFS